MYRYIYIYIYFSRSAAARPWNTCSAHGSEGKKLVLRDQKHIGHKLGAVPDYFDFKVLNCHECLNGSQSFLLATQATTRLFDRAGSHGRGRLRRTGGVSVQLYTRTYANGILRAYMHSMFRNPERLHRKPRIRPTWDVQSLRTPPNFCLLPLSQQPLLWSEL